MGPRRVVVFAFVALLVLQLTGADARADVSRQVRQLRSSDDFKVRLSAALALAKTTDRRAVSALARALARDSSATIRRVAVDSLRRILTQPLPASTVRLGVRALKRAASSDRDRKVRRAAAGAVNRITRRRRRGGGAFVALARPSDPKRRGPRGISQQMFSALQKTVRRGAPAFDVFARSASPRSRGWFVSASIADVDVRRRGASAEVRCQVAVRVSPLLDRQERFIAGETASAKGTGRVIGGASRRAIDNSIRECLLAVVEQVTERQVLPFIKQVGAQRVAGN